MNISHVVDNESQSKGLSFVLATMDSLQFHHGLVSDGVRGIVALEPLIDCWHSHGNVLNIVLEFNLIGRAAVSDEWLIVKMPVGLPSTASSFVVISEGDAFNEWVIFLM
jgi:hypothetical protein